MSTTTSSSRRSRSTATPRELFFARVDKLRAVKGQRHGCWIWKTAGGFFFDGVRHHPRHWAFENFKRRPMVPDTVLRALCKEVRCVHPGHMELMWKGVRSDTHCSRGHKMTDENGSWYINGMWRCRVCRHERYAGDPDKHEENKAAARRRYATDPEYRERVKMRSREAARAKAALAKRGA